MHHHCCPTDDLRDYLALPYAEMEEKNLEMKQLRQDRKSEDVCRKKILKYLEGEKRVKAVTVAFSNMHGRLHMLDYDKKFFLGGYDNLTFDGSSIEGFSELGESDLRFKVDWSSFRWMPADIFGAGKVVIFAFVRNQDGTQYPGDFRGRLAELTDQMHKKDGHMVYMAPEIEGFLLKGEDAEQNYESKAGFEPVTRGGYFNALPQDDLRLFIDTVAEAQRAMGFENEKDHGEVGPAQFEINFRYAEVLTTCDQILLYKLIARQVAKLMGHTASFLPKPVVGINGSGMHSNMSIAKGSKNLFFDKKGKYNLSDLAHKFATGVMYYAQETCLTYVPSVNSYRRLDPNYEAPNEILMSPSNRGAVIRVPIGNEKSARIEVRAVSPDSNPYLACFALIQSGLAGVNASKKAYADMEKLVGKKRILWGNIYEALAAFKNSQFLKDTMGAENHRKYFELKEEVARRCPHDLGTKIKTREVLDHHEVSNQAIWATF